MRERDRLSIRVHRAEVEAQERAEREKREAPIREAEARLKETHRKLHAVTIERLQGKVKDPDRVPVDPELIRARMSRPEADKYNVAEFRKFREAHPEVYLDQQLIENLGAYWDVNGLRIVSANMMAALIDRYRDAGLLPDAPPPEPEPAPEPAHAKPAEPETFTGIDPETGLEKVYTAREVNRMSSETFRRTFRVAGTIAECLTAMKEQKTEG
jgi:hypothetical protein